MFIVFSLYTVALYTLYSHISYVLSWITITVPGCIHLSKSSGKISFFFSTNFINSLQKKFNYIDYDFIKKVNSVNCDVVPSS